MKRPRFIATQSGSPKGPVGWLIARIMERETATANDRIVGRLALAPGHRVLELGCGHGRTLGRIAAEVTQGTVVGIDHSDVMVALACKRNERAAHAGRVDVRKADSAALPFPDASFDRVLAVHTLYFWERPAEHLRECRRVLRNQGIALLAHRPAAEDDGTFPQAVYRFYDRQQLVDLFTGAGFGSVCFDRETVAGLELAFATVDGPR